MNSKEVYKEKFFTSSKIAKCAIFSALAFVLYLFPKFPLPIFASWLEINFSDLPALIGGFMLGPIYGSIIVLMKIVLKLVFGLTATFSVGEFADLIIGCAYVVPAAIIYKKNKNIKGAVIALIVGSLCSTAVAMIANRYILIPFFSQFMEMEALVGSMNVIFKNVTAENFYFYYIFLSVLPFNILRCLIASILTFLLYKRISKIMSGF